MHMCINQAGHQRPSIAVDHGGAVGADDDPGTLSMHRARFCQVVGGEQEADLEIVKTADAAAVNPGDPLVFTLTVTNLGPSDAADVVVLDNVADQPQLHVRGYRHVDHLALILKPGQRGTKKLCAEYGERLLCVRYRYDEERRKRPKTVELEVDEVDWEP